MNPRHGPLVWVLLGLLVLMFLGGGAFVGYKLWKRQQNRALAAELQRWEVRKNLPLQTEVPASELEALVEYLRSL